MLKLAVIVVSLLVCGFIALAALAPHSAAANAASIHVAAFAMKLATFPKNFSGKNPVCTAGDVWEHSASAPSILAREKLESQVRVIASDKEYDQVETPSGTYWIPRRDFGTLIEMLGDVAGDIYHTAGRITPGSIVLDCGANVGVFTRLALDRGAKLVVAIDPAEGPVTCLRRTFAKEIAEGRVIVYPKGVWDKEETLVLTHNPGLASSAQSVALDRGEKGETVPLTTVDRLVEELKLAQVDFIKMDIEGAEPNALRGAAGTLVKFRPRLSIALEHRRDDPDKLPAVVREIYPRVEPQLGPCTSVDGSIQPNVMFVN